jgi:acyl-CoA thioesterase FadM
MIIHTVRVLGLLAVESLKPAHLSGEPFVMRFRAWPWYCDTNLHVNNAAYLTFMEYARWAMSLRTGLLGRALRSRWIFLVAGASVTYRRPLPVLRSFTVRTELIATEGRWLLLSQDFFDHGGRPAARGIVRAMLRGREGPVSPADVLGRPGPTFGSAELAAFDTLSREGLQNLESDAEARPAPEPRA